MNVPFYLFNKQIKFFSNRIDPMVAYNNVSKVFLADIPQILRFFA